MQPVYEDRVWQTIVAAEVTREAMQAREADRNRFLDLLLEIAAPLVKADQDHEDIVLAS